MSSIRSRLGPQKLYKPPNQRDRDDDDREPSRHQPRHSSRNDRHDRGRDRDRRSNDNLRTVQKNRGDSKFSSSRGSSRGRGSNFSNSRGNFRGGFSRGGRGGFSGGYNKSPFSARGNTRGTFSRGGGRGGFFNDKRNRAIRRSIQNIEPIDEKMVKAYCGKICSMSNPETQIFDTLDFSSAKSHDFWSGKTRKIELSHPKDIEILTTTIIGVQISDKIKKINLSRNSLEYCDQFSKLVEGVPNVEMLDLSENRLKEVTELKKYLGKWDKLQHLILKNNPILAENDDNIQKIGTALKKGGKNFKSLISINGVQLHKEAGFDLDYDDKENGDDEDEDEFTIPDTNGHGFPDDNEFPQSDKELIGSIIMDLITLTDMTKEPGQMDNNNRAQHVPTFYSQNANFSMITINPTEAKNTNSDISHLFNYSRNLNNDRIPDEENDKKSYFGHENIMKIYKELPNFCHEDKNQIVYDLIPVMPPFNLIHANYCGEVQEQISETRTAKRMVWRSLLFGLNDSPNKDPNAYKYLILNDCMTMKAVEPANNEEESNQNGHSHKNEENELSPLEMAKKMQEKVDKEKQTEILLKFSNQTNLTLERADECLKQVNWDYFWGFDQKYCIFFFHS